MAACEDDDVHDALNVHARNDGGSRGGSAGRAARPGRLPRVEAPPRRSLRGPLAWLGAGGGDVLAGHVVVVSRTSTTPCSRSARQSHEPPRAQVEVLTVLAGDPEAADVPPGSWDEAAGFTTASAAAAARREEDRAACEHLGARPLWLPFWDRDYGLDRPEPAVREELRRLFGGRDGARPRLAALARRSSVGGRAGPRVRPRVGRVGAYVEQPYALWGLQPEIALPTAGADDWIRLRASLGDRLAKRRAVEAYVTQLPPRRGHPPTLPRDLGSPPRRRAPLAWLTG